VLSNGTKFELQISDDCGDNYTTVYTIDETNHVPTANLTTISVGLDAYAGKSILIRFVGTWGAGDFWFDLDNVNLRACASDMQLTATVKPADPGLNNGTAVVNVGIGNPPYTYHWSTGSTNKVVSNLPIGEITVTVTDALGCSDTLAVYIGNSPTHEIEGLRSLSLRPNPTTGFASLLATFDNPVDAGVQLFDLLGRQLWETNISHSTGLSEQLDLQTLPDGLYLVRLTVNGQTLTKKLVKQQ
jgi:hypothetical protein